MDDNLFSTDEELDDDAFLKSLESLLEEPPESEAQKAPEPKPEEPVKHPPKKAPLPKALGILAGILICIGLIFGIPKALDHFGGTLAEDVSVGPIALGGLTKAEAKKALKEQYLLLQEDLTVTLPRKNAQNVDLSDYPLELTKAATGLKLDIGKAVKDAYALGKQEGDHPLLPYLSLNTDAIHAAVAAYCSDLEGLYRDPSWNQAEGAVEVDLGMPGVTVDEDELYDFVLSCYESNTPQAQYTGSLAFTLPKAPDLEIIYEETAVLPQEPSIDRETLALTKGVPGSGFDLDRAKQNLKKASYGKVLSLPMEEIAPELSDEEVYFQDVLGHCETPYSNNPKRITNLELACKALDGLILEPGQEFSYNDTLGERTAEKGYQPAPAYSGTTLVDSLGGGICQVSSTLYLASVYAELTILERVNHGYPVHYIPYGMDATVNWGFTDLKMRNDSEFPVKIQAEASDGYVKVDILGLETRDYDIKMSYSVGGRYVKTFKTKISKATGKQISKEEVALSAYMEDVFPS